MGKIASNAKTLAKATPQDEFRHLLKENWGKIAAVMPSAMSEERMFQLAVSAYNSEPKLAQCSSVSLLSCVMKCAALGLEPSAVDGLGRAYILPFKNRKTGRMEATFILGYKGMIDLARRSGEIADISARAVYEGDVFEYSYGLDETLRHVPSQEPKTGRELTHAYCVAKFKDGGHYFNVLTAEDIEAARKSSQAGSSKYSPWSTHYESMAVKTAVRRAFPYLPVSVEAQSAAASDETTPDYSPILSPVIDVEPAEAVKPPETAKEAQDAPEHAEQPENPADEATAPRRAVCRSCGNVVEDVAPDATAEDIAFECCESPDYTIEEV